MKTDFWLAIKAKKNYKTWCKSSVRVTSRSEPTVEPHEVAIKLNLEIPDSFFEQPSIKANIIIPEENHPVEFDLEVKQGVTQAIREKIGGNVYVEINDNREEENE